MKNLFKANTNLAIHVNNLEKAKLFYRNSLGFSLETETKKQLTLTSGVLTLYINKDEEIKSFIPALEVRSLKEAKKNLIDNNCKIIKEWPKYKALYFEDPFGICINIIESNF